MSSLNWIKICKVQDLTNLTLEKLSQEIVEKINTQGFVSVAAIQQYGWSTCEEPINSELYNDIIQYGCAYKSLFKDYWKQESTIRQSVNDVKLGEGFLLLPDDDPQAEKSLEDLKQWTLDKAKKYEQQIILVKRPDEPIELLCCSKCLRVSNEVTGEYVKSCYENDIIYTFKDWALEEVLQLYIDLIHKHPDADRK